MQFINTPFRAVAAAAVMAASALASTTASADSLAYAVGIDNWTFSGTSQVDVALHGPSGVILPKLIERL